MLHNEQACDLCNIPNRERVVQTRRLRRTGSVAEIQEMEIAYRTGDSLVKWSLGGVMRGEIIYNGLLRKQSLRICIGLNWLTVWSIGWLEVLLPR
jgi:hypothetical protein